MKPIVKLRQPFGYDADSVSEETGLFCPEETMTQQNTAEQTDINFIVATFARTGLLPQPAKMPTYGDFTGVSDYREALEMIQTAQDSFNSLPADARAYFDNNPANLLDYLENGPDPQILANLGIADVISIPEPTSPPENPENP